MLNKQNAEILEKKVDLIQPDTPKPASQLTPQSQPAAKTVIGQHIQINGDIKGSEDLVIDGSMKGKIQLEKNQLTVGNKGQVEGEVQAVNITIGGRLVGNVNSVGKVQITKTANFSGEIKARSISVEDGAYLKATIELKKDSDKTSRTPSKPVPESDSKMKTHINKETQKKK